MVFVNRRGSQYLRERVSDWNLIVLPPKKDAFRCQYTYSGKWCFEAKSFEAKSVLIFKCQM